MLFRSREEEAVPQPEQSTKMVSKSEGKREVEPSNKSMQKPKRQVFIIKEATFLDMAKNYVSVTNIANAIHKSEYEIILMLRKANIYSRDEVERLIEQGKMTDEQIAGKFGEIEQIAKIRELVMERQRLIDSVSEEQRSRIIEMLVSEYRSIGYIAYKTKKSIEVIKAIKEKYEKDRENSVTPEAKRIQLKIQWMELESRIKSINVKITEMQKLMLDYTIAKILVEYEAMLEPIHYAYITYTYMKMGQYQTGIEFAEEYLNLEEPSIAGVKEKIEETIQLARSKENTGMITIILPEIIEYASR